MGAFCPFGPPKDPKNYDMSQQKLDDLVQADLVTTFTIAGLAGGYFTLPESIIGEAAAEFSDQGAAIAYMSAVGGGMDTVYVVNK